MRVSSENGPGARGRASSGLGGLERYAGYGLALALAVVGGGWAGLALDRWLGTSPALLLFGGFAGAGAGTYTVYQRLVVEPRKPPEEESSP